MRRVEPHRDMFQNENPMGISSLLFVQMICADRVGEVYESLQVAVVHLEGTKNLFM